jgi:hypothetical protein
MGRGVANIAGLEKRYGGSGKKPSPDSQRALSYRGPVGRKPNLSGADKGILTGSAKSTVVAVGIAVGLMLTALGRERQTGAVKS